MTTDLTKGERPRDPRIWRAILRLLLFLVLWLVLTEGDTRKLWLGAGAAGFATMASFIFWPARSWQWSGRGFIRFWPYFFWQSLMGGIDVARRAFSPSMPLEPEVVTFSLRLTSEPAQAFLAWTIGLLPGTASIRLRGKVLEIHVLDRRLPIEERLRVVEQKVGDLFCQELRELSTYSQDSP